MPESIDRRPPKVSRRALLVTAASVLATGRVLRSQEPDGAAKPTFSSGVKVVNVFVTVRDKKGKIVKDLLKEDFTLSEDERPQTIGYFSRESDLPLTIGLIVDTTPSESNMLDEERKTSRAFLNQMLRPDKDRAFLIQFNQEVELLQDLTSSREKLEAALNLLESHQSGKGNGPGAQRGGMPNETILSDAIYLAADEVLKREQGRKALIVMGDGDHIGSREEKAIAAAEQADTLVYAIRIYDRSFGGGGGGGGWGGMGRIPGMGGGPGMGGPGGGPGMGGPGGGGPGGGGPGGAGGPGGSRDGRELKRIARRTGGGYFEVSKKETLEQIYAKIEEELRNQYSLGYTPGIEAKDGYRRIKVDTHKKGLLVQGREGYYAGKKS